MTMLIDSWTFPETAQGLRWSDEYGWSPVAQSTEYGLTGALLVQEGTRQNGRPITLEGGRTWSWITREDLAELQALLDATDQRTLTLHDGRTAEVIPRRDGDGPIRVSALPIVRDSGPADPGDGAWYVIEELRFWIVGELSDA